jgi:pimeloyl-ACP methyl ester carboxylesterase
MNLRHLTTGAVGPLALPLLVIHDRHDTVVPWENGQSVVAAWGNATLVTTEGLGHSGSLQHPDVIARIAGFLAEPVAVGASASKRVTSQPTLAA